MYSVEIKDDKDITIKDRDNTKKENTNKNNDKDKDNSNEGKTLQRTNSFSKEFLLINENLEKKDAQLCQSSRELNQTKEMEEKVLDKPKETLPTIFDEIIKKQPTYKGLKMSFIAGQKDIKNLSNMTHILDNNEKINNINKDDYLQIRQIPKISNEQYERIRREIVGRDNLERIYKYFMDYQCLPLDEIDFHDNIGCLLPLQALLESKYNEEDPSLIEEMYNKYNLYEKYIFKYRSIKGDGNCFYRAVVFRYFEIIILNRKIDLLKYIIYDIKESFNSNEIRSRIRVKIDTVLNTSFIKILIIILELLEDNRISDAHYLYVKCININPLFDYGLIIYFRYIFYNYIKNNENKLYLETFPIKIGNLLPSKYEKENCGFLFNKFYYCYLLSMFTDAEKIIIYLTPFVLGVNLDVIVFNDNEDETIKNVNFAGKSEYDFNNDKIFVLNVKGHYELLYSKNDYDKYQSIFKNYANNYLNNFTTKHTPKDTTKGNNSTTPQPETITKTGDKDLINNNKNERVYSGSETKNNNYNYNNSRNTLNRITVPCKYSKTNNNNNNQKNYNYYNTKTADNKNKDIHNNNNFDNPKKDYIFRSPNNSRNTKNITYYSIKEKNSNTNNNNSNNKSPSPTYKYKYSNIQKSNEQYGRSNIIDKDKIKQLNKLNYTEKKPIKNLGILYENQNKRYKGQNINNNLMNNNCVVDCSEDIEEENENRQKIKDSMNIKSLDLTQKKNDIKCKKIIIDNPNKEQSLNKSEDNNNNDNIKTNNGLSKRLISPVKTKELELNDNQCQLCSTQYNINNGNEKIPNICYDCLKNEIINQIYPIYISYVVDSIGRLNYDFGFKSNFENFIQKELVIYKTNITIDNAIKELYYKKKDKNSSKNESQERQSLFREIKKRFCIICQNELSSQKYQIPCGCNFCSIEHVKEYFHLKNKLLNKTYYVCICSYTYSCQDIYNLGLFFLKNRLFSLKNEAIDIINEYLNRQCCFCSLSIDLDERIRIKYKDIDNNPILGDCTQLRHYLCESCYMGYNYNEVFFCNFCNKSHVYYPQKNL